MSVWKGGVWASQKGINAVGPWKGSLWRSERRLTSLGIKKLLFGQGQQGVMYVPQPTVNGQQVLFQDSAGTTPVTADGQPVGYIKDLSGNGNHATQTTSLAKPIYPDLLTDGVDDYLNQDFDYGDVSTGFCISVAAKLLNLSADNDYVFGLRRTDGLELFGIRYSSTKGISGVVQSTGNAVTWVPTGMPLDSQPHVMTLLVNSTDFEFYVNGVLISTRTAAGNIFLNRLSVGAFNRSTPEYFSNANIFGAVAVKDVVTATQRKNIESYLADLSGVTL